MPLPMLSINNAYLGFTRVVGDNDFFLSWTPGGSTAYLRRAGFEEIELRMDREVCEIFVGSLSLPMDMQPEILFIVYQSCQKHQGICSYNDSRQSASYLA